MLDEKSQFIDDIDQLLRDAICAKSEQENLAFLELAKLKGQNFLSRFPYDSDASHMMGLVIYEFPGYEKLFTAEKYFRDAVQKNPANQFAVMYLGHSYFDTKKFSEALSCFEKIDDDYFISENKMFRAVKLHELILCCKIQVNSKENFVKKFDDFVKEFENLPEESFSLPYEFAMTLAETKENVFWQSFNREEIVKAFTQILTNIGYKNTFKEYIEKF